MTIAQILLEDFDMEMSMTRRILGAIPDGQPDFKPHEKSMALGRLAMHIANLPLFGYAILTTPEVDVTTYKFPSATFVSAAQVLTVFDDFAAQARAALAGSSDDELQQAWTLRAGDHVITGGTKSSCYRHMFVSHMVHHRAQLGVYLRLLDLPVPGVYGPSADERRPA